jgi:molybdopterin synthase catalytic subunit
MKVDVRLFAAVKDAAGSPRLGLVLPDGATIADLRRRMVEELPQAAGLLHAAMFAIDAEYAPDARQITPGCDVACIPPVSGG